MHLDAGTIRWHEQHGLLLVFVRVGRVGFPHDDEDFAAVVAGATGPPFRAVEDVVVAALFHAELDVAAVRGGDVGFGHQEAGTDLAGHEGFEPLVFLRGGAVAGDDFHVAGIGSCAVACLEEGLDIGPEDDAYWSR